MPESVKVFLSTVSDEFRAYRDQLRADLTRPDVEVKVQEDFVDLGGDTLDKLDVYIAHCDCVVHLVGDMTGSAPLKRDVESLLAKCPDLVVDLSPLGEALRDGVDVSYTQWEAWLALYHRKPLLIAKAADTAVRGPTYAPTDTSRAAQAEHLARLKALKRYPGCTFASPDNLANQIAYSVILDLLAKARAERTPRRPKNLPFASLGSLFKGREQDLDTLHQALTADSGRATAIVGRALHGLGGIGKTRLAVEYALRHESEHSALLFVRADTPAALDTSLAALAGSDILDLPEKDAREDAAKIAAALGWLAAHPGWLMIVDNVDDQDAVAAVDKLLARLSGGKVVVTGRAGNFPASLRKLELGVLDEAASVAFLMERTDADRAHSSDDAKLAQELAGELGGLALGLEQAGAYIATERIGFARYLRLWRDKRATVLDWFDKTLMSYDHDAGLAATWATSVDRLTPDARRLLERLAFLAPEPVPISLLEAVPTTAPEASFWRNLLDRFLSSLRSEPAGLTRSALADLFAYSLVSRASVETGKTAQDGFAVHRLVQDFARRAMTEERRGEALREALVWVESTFVGDGQDVRNWPVLEPLAPHALAVARQADSAQIAEPTARLFSRLAVLFQVKARYTEAESLCRRALSIVEVSFGSNHPEAATDINNLATLLRATNRFDEAESLFRRALAIDEASYGPDHPKLAIGLNNLAGLLEDTNCLGEAELLFRRALAINEARLATDHPIVATVLNNLALVLCDMHRLDEAEPLYRRALAIDEASLGPDHPDVARDLNNLAGLLQDTSRLGKAEPLYRRALAIVEASYGPDHPNVATALDNLAGLLRNTDRLGEAEPLYRRALTIDEATFGPDHSRVAKDLNNLAGLLQDADLLSEAEPLFRRALLIQEARLGSDHPVVATTLNNLALLLRATQRLDEAERLMRRALAIDEVGLGPDHPNVAYSLNNLAALLQSTNRFGEAEPLYRRALVIDEATYGPDHSNVATGLNNLAELLRATNRHGEAEPLFRRALAIAEASLGADHPDVARDLNNLAALLRDTNRLGEAEPLFRRALAIFEVSYGPDHPWTAAARANLSVLGASRG